MSNRPIFKLKCPLLVAVFLALSLAPILVSIPNSNLHPKLAEFYAVDVWDDDFYPYWQSAILHITRQENGVKVLYVYIASATQPCDDPAIRTVTVFLPNTKLEQLTNGLDLCLLDTSTFNRNVANATKKPEPFDTMRSAVVARCGVEDRIFEMPRFKTNGKTLKKVQPSALPMLQLSNYVLRKAFPIDKTRDIFWGVDSSLTEISEGSSQLGELRAGAFDKAYWFGLKGVHPGIPAQVLTSVDPTIGSDSDLGKLRNILAKYKHPARGNSGRIATLADSQGFRLKLFVAPIYPPLAVQTRIEEKVILSLRVDHATGKVESADVLSGHALLKDSSTTAARQWQFDPAQGLSERIKVALDFSLHCGN